MKINKILFRISHFFGFRLDEEYHDDITINISTNYQNYFLKNAFYEITFNNKCDSKEAQWIINDIIRQIYNKFEKDPYTEKKCRNVKKVYVTYYKNSDKYKTGSIVTTIPYVDGILYNPFDKGILKSLDRNNKIEQILKDKN